MTGAAGGATEGATGTGACGASYDGRVGATCCGASYGEYFGASYGEGAAPAPASSLGGGPYGDGGPTGGGACVGSTSVRDSSA